MMVDCYHSLFIRQQPEVTYIKTTLTPRTSALSKSISLKASELEMKMDTAASIVTLIHLATDIIA